MRLALLPRLLLVCLGSAALLASAQTPRLPASPAATAQTAQVTLSPGYQSPNPGQMASVAAAVTPGTGSGPTPTGTVTFYDSYAGNTTQISSPLSLLEGQLTDGWTTLGVGSHSITGHYSGDANYAPAASSPVTILVQKFSPTLTLTLSTATPAAGGSLTATATLLASSSIPPTGSVTFTLDNSTQGIASLSGSGSSYSATLSIPIATGGPHTIGASYGGDANYASATATPASITTGKVASVTTLSALPATLTAGTPETLTASLAPAAATSGSSTFTGTVSFFDGATLLGAPVTVAANQASLSGLSLSTTATHSLTAVYSGDSNWLGSTSTPLVLTVTGLPTTVTLTASSPIALAGSLVTFNVTVAGPANASTLPSGTVTFYDADTSLAQTTLATTAGKAAATWSTSTLAAGSHLITAHYAGDTSFKAAVSSPLTLAIESFAITPSATSLTLKQGQSGTIVYTIADADSSTTSVQFACAPPPGTSTTCAFSPASVSGNGQASLTIATAGPAQSSALRSPGKGSALLACLFLISAPLGLRLRRSRLLILLLTVGLFGAAATLLGCGSSSRSAASSTLTPPGTQVFAITTSTAVNGQTLNQNTWVTVNVLPAS